MKITGNYAYFASTTLHKQDDISRDDGLLCARVTEPSTPQSTISDVTNVKTLLLNINAQQRCKMLRRYETTMSTVT